MLPPSYCTLNRSQPLDFMSLHAFNLHTASLDAIHNTLTRPQPDRLLHPIWQPSQQADFACALGQEDLSTPTPKDLLDHSLGHIIGLHNRGATLLQLCFHWRKQRRAHPVRVNGGGQNFGGVVGDAEFLIESCIVSVRATLQQSIL